jgi:hypothetical protein
MELKDEMEEVREKFPAVYEYIRELEKHSSKVELPKFDDNDEWVCNKKGGDVNEGVH